MKQRKRMIIQGALLATSVLFILTGIYREEAGVVFTKAVNICLECIGIG